MRILHIDTGLSFRGGQRQAEILHLGLLESGIESFFLANGSGKLIDRLPNSISLHYKSELSLSTHLEFIKHVKRIKPDIVQTHDGHAVAIAVFHKKLGYKVVETRRVSYQIPYISRVFKYSNVDLHVAVSEEIKEYLSKYFKNVVKISSCIDLNRFCIEQKKLFNEEKVNILYVGAFTKQKGIDLLLKAFKNIKNDNINLHMLGDGELLEEMKSLAKDDERIVFYGRREDVEQFYLNASFVVVPSVDGEGSSGVIKESFAAGKLVIASDLNANRELIADRVNGLLFKCGSEHDLKEKILSVLSGDITVDSCEIKKISKKFSCSYLVKQCIYEYQKILV